MDLFKSPAAPMTPDQQFRSDVMEHGLELAVRLATVNGATARQLAEWAASLNLVPGGKRSEGIGGIKLELL